LYRASVWFCFMDSDKPIGRKHLRRLNEIWSSLQHIIYLVSFCTLDRTPILDRPQVFDVLSATLKEAAEKERWLIGLYVVMPEHVHMFCSPAAQDADLSLFLKRFKSMSTRRLWALEFPKRIWQREFHDHLLRSDESYAKKWEYVRRNPLGLSPDFDPEKWPYKGELHRFE
jgi:putative transposase